MYSTIINEANNFATWAPKMIAELRQSTHSSELGSILYENETLKLMELTLQPHERVPFTLCNSSGFLYFLTEGLLLSRRENGQIVLIRFAKGESLSIDTTNKKIVKDMQNVGDEVLRMMILERK